MSEKLNKNDLYVFGLTASKEISKEVCKILDINEKNIKVTRFADGEILTESLDSVRGKEIYIIQSTSNPANEHLMELLIAIDSFKRASAKKINVIIPYYGYARQDRKAKGRQPITSKLIADLLTQAGAHRVIVFDMHSPQAMGFFNVPADNFHTAQIFANRILDLIIQKKYNAKDCILVSPDYGGLTRVHQVDKYIKNMTNGLAIIGKRRPEPNKAEVEFVLGDIKDKTCFIIDDIIDTGGTILNAAKALKENGAKKIYIFASHGLFNRDAKEKFSNAIKDNIIESVIVTNTINIPEDKKFEGLEIVSISNMLSDMILALMEKTPLTDVYIKNKNKILDKVTNYLKNNK